MINLSHERLSPASHCLFCHMSNTVWKEGEECPGKLKQMEFIRAVIAEEEPLSPYVKPSSICGYCGKSFPQHQGVEFWKHRLLLQQREVRAKDAEIAKLTEENARLLNHTRNVEAMNDENFTRAMQLQARVAEADAEAKLILAEMQQGKIERARVQRNYEAVMAKLQSYEAADREQMKPDHMSKHLTIIDLTK